MSRYDPEEHWSKEELDASAFGLSPKETKQFQEDLAFFGADDLFHNERNYEFPMYHRTTALWVGCAYPYYDNMYEYLEYHDVSFEEPLPEPCADTLYFLEQYGKIHPGEPLSEVLKEAADAFITRRIQKIAPTITRVLHGKMIGQIVDILDIPYAESIWHAVVDVGHEEPYDIAWGGMKILEPGQHVIVALTGALLANGKRLRNQTYTMIGPNGEKKKFTSRGMFLSWEEANLPPPIQLANQVAIVPSTKKFPLRAGMQMDNITMNPDGTVRREVQIYDPTQRHPYLPTERNPHKRRRKAVRRRIDLGKVS